MSVICNVMGCRVAALLLDVKLDSNLLELLVLWSYCHWCGGLPEYACTSVTASELGAPKKGESAVCFIGVQQTNKICFSGVQQMQYATSFTFYLEAPSRASKPTGILSEHQVAV